jgi:ATP/maltotriose-dependent transcriptional regulator MalT
MLAYEEEPALEWGIRATELAEELGNVEILVHAMTNVGSAESLKDQESGHEKIERALQIAREKEMHDHVARCYSNLSSNYIRSRQYAQGERWLEEGLEYTTDRDIDFYRGYLLGWKAQLFFDIGDWAKVEEPALAALHLSRNVKATTQLPALIALGHLKVRQGDSAAQEVLDRAQSLAIQTGELQRIGPLASARAEAAWWRGDRDGAAAEASNGYELALSRNDSWTLGQVAYWIWRAGEENIPVERVALPYALMISGEWQEAAGEWERIGCPFERALALAEGDDPAKRKALEIFERLGARPAAQDLRERLQARGIKIIAPKRAGLARDNLIELTPRELEVLRLIAEGLTNPAIAERLTISVGTVKAHTANIYTKLGVRNRVQALAVARDRAFL